MQHPRFYLAVFLLSFIAVESGVRDGFAQVVEDPFRGGKQFVSAAVDKEEVYVNEPLLYTFRYYSTTALPFSDDPRYEPPRFEGFRYQEWPAGPTKRETIDGVAYRVHENSISLFPSQSGTLTIGSGMLRIPGLNFFDRPRIFRSDPVSVRVNPLPERGKPPSFTGAVGDYELRVSVDKTEVAAGEAVTLYIQIAGIGDVEKLRGPGLPHIKGVTVYDPTIRAGFIGRGPIPRGYNNSEYVLIPQKQGRFTIPSLTWSYFDPETATYQQRHTAPIPIHAHGLPGTVPSGTASSETAIARESALRPIKPDSVDLTDHRQPLYTQPVFWLIQLLPASAFFAVWIYRQRREAVQESLEQRQVLQRTHAQLQRWIAEETPPADLFDRLHHLMDRYLMNRFGLSFDEEGLSHLAEQDVDARTGERLSQLSQTCQYARFAPAEIGTEEKRSALAMARDVLLALEDET